MLGQDCGEPAVERLATETQSCSVRDHWRVGCCGLSRLMKSESPGSNTKDSH